MGSKNFKRNRKERRAEHFSENSETWQKMQKDFEEHMKKWEMENPPDESEDEDDPFASGEEFADFCEMLYAFPYGSEYWGKKLLDKYFYGEEVIEETP